MTDGPGTTGAGWYPDPDRTGQDRWWDGHAWTSKRRPHDAPHLTPTVIAAPTRSARPNPYARSSGSSTGAGASTGSPWGARTRPRSTTWGGASGAGFGGRSTTANPNQLTTVGFVMSLVGIVMSVFGLLSLAGAIVSLLALPRARRLAAAGSARTGRGIAIAGVVIGGLSFFGWMLIWLVVGLTTLLPTTIGAG